MSSTLSKPSSPVVPLLLSMSISQLSLGLIGPLVPLLLLAAGADAREIGTVTSCFAVGFIIGTLTLGNLVRRVGHRATFAAMTGLAMLAALAMTTLHGAVAWAVLRGCLGIAHAGFCIVVESWLNSYATNRSRGKIFSAYMLVNWAGTMVGPLAISGFSASPFLLVAAAIGLLVGVPPLLLSKARPPPPPSARRMGLRGLWVISPVGLACCATAGLCNGVLYALSPVPLAARGFDQSSIALFLFGLNVAGMAIQLPLGLLADRFGRRAVVVTALGIGTVLGLLLHGATLPGWGLFIALAGMAMTSSGMYGLGSGQTNDRLAELSQGGGDTVAASGGLLLAWAIGAAIGPMLAGVTMDAAGASAMFLYLSAVMGTVATFTAMRMVLRSDAPRTPRAAVLDGTPAGRG